MRSTVALLATLWASPALAIDLCQPPAIAPATSAVVQVSGANPGESVTLARGSGPGSTCPAGLGGACLALSNLSVVATANANANGVATFTLPIPSTVPAGASIGMQAAIRRGAGGVSSVVSDPFYTRVVATAAGQDCATGNVCADRDADRDAVHDVCDVCPNGSDTNDGDGDGVPDGCDVCPGGSDTLDTDNDGVPDGCDMCPASDDTADADLDGVPDGCDICPGGDDTVDSDRDMFPDACDVCPQGDDLADADGDTVPDACDVCPTGDDLIDTDADGVPDACEAPDTGLVAWWSFEGQSGMDMSGNGHDIVSFTNTTWATGPSGDALRLRGRGWADVAASNDFDLPNGFTFSAWIRPDNITGFRGIISRTPRMGAVQDWAFYTRNDELCAYFNYPTPRVPVISTGVDLALSVWVHVATSWDPNTQSVHFYKNGQWVQSMPYTGGLNSNNVGVVIGSDGAAPSDFIGYLDELTVWNRPLDASEIADLATP